VLRAAATEAPPVASTSKPAGPIIMNGQILHSLTPKRLELVNGMSEYVEQQVYPLLKPVDKCWQPYDFLPRSEDPDFLDKVRKRRAGAAGRRRAGGAREARDPRRARAARRRRQRRCRDVADTAAPRALARRRAAASFFPLCAKREARANPPPPPLSKSKPHAPRNTHDDHHDTR